MRNAARIQLFGVALLCLVMAAHCGIGVQSAHAASPRLVAIEPSPQNWKVDAVPLSRIELQFDSPVTLPDGSVTARSQGGGTRAVSVFPPPGVLASQFEITLTPPISVDRVTVVVDYSIANALGEALDGETGDPANPALPSGDGRRGGQAVFQITVLQGDVNRDGTVNIQDSIMHGRSAGLCQGQAGFDPNADVNGDGCVDGADGAIITAWFGGKLPRATGATPLAFVLTPGPLPFPEDVLTVRFSEAMNPDSVLKTSVFGVGLLNGELIVASELTASEDRRTFSFRFDGVGCLQDFDFRVSNGVASEGGVLLPHDPVHCGQCFFTVAGADVDPPVILCPEALYVNSTEPLRIAAGEMQYLHDIQDFLDGAIALDACGQTQISTSLDVPRDLPLGLTMVEFTAVDEASPPNTARCEAALIVVPAMPIYCWDLNMNGRGDRPTEDVNGDGVVDLDDCRGAQGETGAVGPKGADGLSCWDLNGNGEADLPDEDLNGDEIVNADDCQGPEGAAGASGASGTPGATGMPGAEGPTGPQGQPGEAGRPGIDGQTGAAGEPGTPGADGADGDHGVHCWDLNANGIEDDDEDLNGDGLVSVEDCRGTQGEPGATTPAPAVCGAAGLLPLLLMLGGMTSLRWVATRRRVRPTLGQTSRHRGTNCTAA